MQIFSSVDMLQSDDLIALNGSTSFTGGLAVGFLYQPETVRVVMVLHTSYRLLVRPWAPSQFVRMETGQIIWQNLLEFSHDILDSEDTSAGDFLLIDSFGDFFLTRVAVAEIYK
jgi:hypothetical protein